MDSRTTSPVLSEKQILINRFCDLAAAATTTRAMMEDFLLDAKIDDAIDAAHSQSEEPVVNLAAHSGSAEVLQFLIEEKNATVDVANHAMRLNLFDCALENPSEAVKQYLTDPNKKLWLRFNDQTTDLHAAVYGARQSDIISILSRDPHSLIAENQKKRGVFTMVKRQGYEKIADALIAFGLHYTQDCETQKSWGNMAIYYHQLADYYQSTANDLDMIRESYESSIYYYNEAIAQAESEHANKERLADLYANLMDCQLKYAYANSSLGEENYENKDWRHAINLFETSETYFDEAIETQRKVRPSTPSIKHLQSEKISATIMRASAHFELGKQERTPEKQLIEYRISIRLITGCIQLIAMHTTEEYSQENIELKNNCDDCLRHLATFYHACSTAYQDSGSKALKEKQFTKAISMGFQKAIRNINKALDYQKQISAFSDEDHDTNDSLQRLLAVNQYHISITHLNNIETGQSASEAQQVFLSSYDYLHASIHSAVVACERIKIKTQVDTKNLELFILTRDTIEKRKLGSAQPSPQHELAEKITQAAAASSMDAVASRMTQTSSNLFQANRSTTPPPNSLAGVTPVALLEEAQLGRLGLGGSLS
jgi:tetratricopeptide (TPR) repeat protein